MLQCRFHCCYKWHYIQHWLRHLQGSLGTTGCVHLSLGSSGYERHYFIIALGGWCCYNATMQYPAIQEPPLNSRLLAKTQWSGSGRHDEEGSYLVSESVSPSASQPASRILGNVGRRHPHICELIVYRNENSETRCNSRRRRGSSE